MALFHESFFLYVNNFYDLWLDSASKPKCKHLIDVLG